MSRIHAYLEPLHEAFDRNRNAKDAVVMRSYMKGHFPFFGIKTPQRRALMKDHMADVGPPFLTELPAIARSAFMVPEREMHQVAVDLMIKYARKLGPDELPLVEELITTKSWWDSVDALAVHVAGVILKKHPQLIAKWNERWIASDDLWLNRTAIIFQLAWKEGADKNLIFSNIDRHAARKEFFIRKAIGWALRTLSAADPDAVRDFVASRDLAPLSAREALRNIA